MNLFINNSHIFLTSQAEDLRRDPYDVHFNLKEQTINFERLKGKVRLDYPSNKLILQIIHGIIKNKDSGLQYISCLDGLVESQKTTRNFIKDDFKVIKAAGGMVCKGDKILMIHRLGRWDLPKGKMEEGEKRKVTAVREVEEECNVKVDLLYKLCTTWHHYHQNQDHILKQTKWYLMKCRDDQDMKPQREEDIDALKWLSLKEASALFDQTYPAIRFVIRHHPDWV